MAEAIIRGLLQRRVVGPDNVVASAPRAERRAYLVETYGLRAVAQNAEAVRDATRPTREAIAASIESILSRHWPAASPADRATAARMVVLAGDGLLREAFRLNHRGDRRLLEESKLMLRSYLVARLGEPA